LVSLILCRLRSLCQT